MNDPISELSQRVTQSLGEVVGETRSAPPGPDAIHGAVHRRRQKRLAGMGACLSLVLVAGFFGASSLVGNGGDEETVVVAAKPTTEAVEVDRPTSTASSPTPVSVVVASPDDGDDDDGDGADSPLASWEFPLNVSAPETSTPTATAVPTATTVAAAPAASTATTAPAAPAAPTATVAPPAPTATQIPVELATPVQVTPTNTPTAVPTPISCELGARNLTLAEARAVEEACTQDGCASGSPVSDFDDNGFSDDATVRLEVVRCVANTPVPANSPTPTPTEAVDLAPAVQVSCQVGVREVSLAAARATRAGCEISATACTDVIRSVSFQDDSGWPAETRVSMEIIEISCSASTAIAPTMTPAPTLTPTSIPTPAPTEIPVELAEPVQVTPTPTPTLIPPTPEGLIPPIRCVTTAASPDCVLIHTPNPDGSCPTGTEPEVAGSLCTSPYIENSSPDDDLVGGG